MRPALPVAVIVAIIAFDQGTKRLAEAVLARGAVSVAPFFDLVLGYNRGISFGLFRSDQAYAPYALSLLALVAIAALAVWLWRSETRIQSLGLAAIIGGAVSNVVDRLQDGAVTDFLDFYAGAYHWPAFNFADAAITCGVAALLLDSMWPQSKSVNAGPGKDGGEASTDNRQPTGAQIAGDRDH